jgi:hypothetical protein
MQSNCNSPDRVVLAEIVKLPSRAQESENRDKVCNLKYGSASRDRGDLALPIPVEEC